MGCVSAKPLADDKDRRPVRAIAPVLPPWICWGVGLPHSLVLAVHSHRSKPGEGDPKRELTP